MDRHVTKNAEYGQELTGDQVRRARARGIADRIATGTSLTAACALEGVSQSLVQTWRQNDPVISQMIDEARALSEEQDRALLQSLIAGGQKTANVQLHKMATRYQAWMPPKERREVSGPEGGPQKHEHDASPALLGELVRIARTKGETK